MAKARCACAFAERGRTRIFAQKKNTYKTRRFLFSFRHNAPCLRLALACAATSPGRFGVLNGS